MIVNDIPSTSAGTPSPPQLQKTQTTPSSTEAGEPDPATAVVRTGRSAPDVCGASTSPVPLVGATSAPVTEVGAGAGSVGGPEHAARVATSARAASSRRRCMADLPERTAPAVEGASPRHLPGWPCPAGDTIPRAEAHRRAGSEA